MSGYRLDPCGDSVYEIATSHRQDMRVPARVFADSKLLDQIRRDRSLEQLVNVTTLPGIVEAAYGMPDMHEGYGFPVGGVAATRLPDGVISPGGIGFDINCGVRLLQCQLSADEIKPQMPALVHELSRSVPAGYGWGGRWELPEDALLEVLQGGAGYLVRHHGFGTEDDLEAIESRGCLGDADPTEISEKALLRGKDQLGTLGGGNHFLEVQAVDEILDVNAAAELGLVHGQVTVLIHTGSRGLGHQVCTDYVAVMDRALKRHGLSLVDRQLACAPFSSPEGQRYFKAMCAAANFAFANRQTIAHRTRQVFARMFPGRQDAELKLVYDVAHNIAKLEDRPGGYRVCVHRKGATRAFGPAAPELAPRFRKVGQPVLIPGSMGTASFVLVGQNDSKDLSMSSSCHGAGRAMSRAAAKKKVSGQELRRQLESQGIVVKCPSAAELAEEAPLAYKDVDRVVNVVAQAGIARKVARLVPLGVVKG
jgi:tRNA-splicing ligase RtcB